MAKAATKTNKTTRSPRRTTVSNNNKNTRSKTTTAKNNKLEAEVEEKPKKTTSSRRSTTKTTGRTPAKKTQTPKKTETKTTSANSRKNATGASTSTRKTTKTTTKAKETETPKTSASKTTTRSKATSASEKTTKGTTRKTPASKTTKTSAGRKSSTTRKASGTTNRRTNSRANNRRKKEEINEQEEVVLDVPPEEVVILEEDVQHEQDEFHHEQSQESETPDEDDIVDVELFDENTVDKAIELVNVAFVHHTSKIMDYSEGNRLIVRDTLGNRYKLNLKPSQNPIVDPKVSSFYVMRPANFREGEKFESELFALFSNEEVATMFLANIVEIHDKNGNRLEDESFNIHEKRNQLINIHSAYLTSNSGISKIFDWVLKNKKIVLSLAAIILFVLVAFFFISNVFSSKTGTQAGAANNSSHKSYVALSPTEEKIRADNTVISEIDRIQNNQPPIGSVGTNIRSHGLDAEKLALLKKNMQDDVARLIELQGKMNSGMGAVTGGHNVPFNSQTDRFGISNVPPEDSWATSTGARMSVPSGSNGVASQKDLAEFGIINQ